MKAIVYHGNKDIRYTDSHPSPNITHETEVKIKVDFCGICGSDLHEYLDGPIFFQGEKSEISNISKVQCMGHEISGEVVEIGPEVKALKVGEKVVVEASGTCLDRYRFPDAPNAKKPNCCACHDDHRNACDHIGFVGLGFMDGGFSDYCIVGQEHVVPYPEDLIPADVAAITEPLSVAWHAVRTSNFQPGQLALVLGSGPIGLAAIIALKGHKAGKIVVSEPALSRRVLAQDFGAEVIDPKDYSYEECIKALKLMTVDGFGFHHSYDCSGIAATFNASVHSLRTFGTATNIAIWPHKPIDFYPMDVTFKEKVITGSMCTTRLDFEQVIDAYKKGLIDPNEVKRFITSRIHLEDGIEKGFMELINNKDKHIKILMTPNEQFKRTSLT